ncbi:hypothetical protein Gotur_015297 [Gossypium turneri]
MCLTIFLFTGMAFDSFEVGGQMGQHM